MQWVEEKTGGRWASKDVASVSIETLRKGGPSAVCEELCALSQVGPRVSMKYNLILVSQASGLMSRKYHTALVCSLKTISYFSSAAATTSDARTRKPGLIVIFCFIQGSVCVVNAASNRDIEVFAAGMIQVMYIIQASETPIYSLPHFLMD